MPFALRLNDYPLWYLQTVLGKYKDNIVIYYPIQLGLYKSGSLIISNIIKGQFTH